MTDEAFLRELEAAVGIRPGAITNTRTLDDGRTLDLYPLLWGRYRMLVTLADEVGLGFADEAWEFDTIYPAIAAHSTWDGTNEPAGWSRHGRDRRRRRPGGDPAEEVTHE